MLHRLRHEIRSLHLADEGRLLERLIAEAAIDPVARARIHSAATRLVENIRADDRPGLMEVFLAEYGLSSDEGVALMCLAEALLRVPDDETMDDLIEDKIAPSAWGKHLGHSSSSLVNASTWALMLTGRILDDKKSAGIAHTLHGAIKRLGEPVIRIAVKRAMKELGSQFVLGETIGEAVARGLSRERQGYRYSYDMLGEAALTARDADIFFAAYRSTIEILKDRALSGDIRENPGVSIKLSALHPRYEMAQRARAVPELAGRTLELAVLARSANMGLNIDAEEADRLDLSLDIIEMVLKNPQLSGWDGFGVVVQAYGKRAGALIDWLYALAKTLDRKIMVRLVKGAYWDTEIKRAQVEGLSDFPVFTEKAATDVSYICCAKKLLSMTDRIYPQFATHNAHSVASILEFAGRKGDFEFQRLHGMGEALHRQIMEEYGTRCRIYAPVGAHKDLLAYLVRRLLENGANSSFVNQIVDTSVPAYEIASDPFDAIAVREKEKTLARGILRPADLFAGERENSRGFDLRNQTDLERIDAAREVFQNHQWKAEPLLVLPYKGEVAKDIVNPADPEDRVGRVIEVTKEDVALAVRAATIWSAPAAERAAILMKASHLYEENFGEFFAVLTREAGKLPLDGVAELREAVDFLRYYASRIDADAKPCGLFACISPWNFPLAIFTGQIAAALAAGNGVLAKPADPTPIIASIAVKLFHQAGVPKTVLQLLPGTGADVGSALTREQRIDGVCFTGSLPTAHKINQTMARFLAPTASLIAETGGINAMIVDSTALPEQAVRDIVTSAFRSAGQRCSALRILYVQDDVADSFIEMLLGAMRELVIGDPWDYATDVGPLISESAHRTIGDYIAKAEKAGRLLAKTPAPERGFFVPACVIEVNGIFDIEKEVFGPVLHLARFNAQRIDAIIEDINASGYGLTFGLHTRIDGRVEHLTTGLKVGNIYINRNQIGAVVGSQPFGGEGLSGTGPKAGGPYYLKSFTQAERGLVDRTDAGKTMIEAEKVQHALDAMGQFFVRPLAVTDMPGPTGESNRLKTLPRGIILCLGPSLDMAEKQAAMACEQGCGTLVVAPGARGATALDGFLDRADLATLKGFDGVALWSGEEDLKAARIALSNRRGPILPLMTERDIRPRCILERHICIDTTATGGNTSLLAAQD